MFQVVFRNRKRADIDGAAYGADADRMEALARAQAGFVSFKSYTADDGEVAKWINARGRPNLYYARQRARNLGRAVLVRLLTGCLHTQRLLRQSGTNAELALETLVLHAQRIIRPAGR